MRLELTDLDLDLRSAPATTRTTTSCGASTDTGPAKLVLAMDSATANAYLQGRESLAVGIARGRVGARGDPRRRCVYLPLLRLSASRTGGS